MSTIHQLAFCKSGDHISPDVATTMVCATVGAFSGWAAVHIFMNLNPVIGLVFGASAVLVSHLLRASSILEFFKHSELKMMAGLILTFLAYIAGGYLGVALFGYHINFQASLCLGLLMIPISGVIAIALRPIWNSQEGKRLNID